MTATIHPFPRLTGDYERKPTGSSRLGHWQGPLKGHPTPSDSEVLRQTHQYLADCWALRAESRRIKRRYEERQRKIEVLLAGIPADVERA